MRNSSGNNNEKTNTAAGKVTLEPWIFCTDDALNTISSLSYEFHFAVEQVLDVLIDFEVPHIEKRKTKDVVYLRLPDTLNKGHRIKSRTMLIMFNKKHVAIITDKEYKFLIPLLEMFKKYRIKMQAELIFTAIMQVIGEYMKEIMSINDAMQDQFVHFRQVDDSSILELLKYDQLNNLYLSALMPLPQILNGISGTLELTEDDKDTLESVHAKLQQAISICEATDKLIISIRDSYQTIFTNSLSKKVQFLSGITIVLTIPNIIGSLWGMNVAEPLASSPYAFLILCVSAAVLSAVVFVIFKNKKWI